MCVVSQYVQSGKVVWNPESAVLPLEELALISLQLVLQTLPPLRHSPSIVLRNLA
jgi:hypothetical protein